MAKVMVVEDKPMNIELTTDLLKLYGYEVIQTENGYKALDRVKKKRLYSHIVGYAIVRNGWTWSSEASQEFR